jgi:hypothetical protein
MKNAALNNDVEERENIYHGYSDEKLEALSKLNYKLEAGFSPWATWESENSSFGKTFRKWSKFTRFLPIFIASDHGVHWGAKCWPNEIENRYRAYFTWNKKKNDLMRSIHKKKSYYVPHPWVYYRKKYYPKLPMVRSGTLVFFAHSNQTTTPTYNDLDGYINGLKELPEKYQPVVICLSFHDINKGLHTKLRKYQLPIVTAGITNSQDFVDRFYSLVSKFRFSSSSNIGSHTYYLIEAGIPFFLFGADPEYNIKGSRAVSDGKQNIMDYGDKEDLISLNRFKEILSIRTDQVTDEQQRMVSKYLGMDSEMTRFGAFLIFWRELFLNLGDLPAIYSPLVVILIKKFKHWVTNTLSKHSK